MISKSQITLNLGRMAFVFVVFNFFSLRLFSASMGSACYLVAKEGQQIEGVNTKQMFEIASVSKIYTSFWATHLLGSDYRYPTEIYLKRIPITSKKIKEGTFDVHFKGYRDPYTGREMMQYVLSVLQQKGVMHIRELTFDDQFKFLQDVRLGPVAQGYFKTSDPSAPTVLNNLKLFFNNINKNYSYLQQAVYKDMGIKLPILSRLLKPDQILFSDSTDEYLREFDQKIIYRSAPLIKILKEMNRNSNNHAANQIFESLGGAPAFVNFLKSLPEDLSASTVFYNGSGDRAYTSEAPETKVYNQATCESVIKMMVFYDAELKSHQLTLLDVLSVAGQDYESAKSTVTSLYNTSDLTESVAAKTGTVNPSVTLAGLLSTKQGDVYFNYIYKTNGRDWTKARFLIRNQLNELVKKFGGKDPYEYEPLRFLPFDQNSMSEITNSASRSSLVPELSEKALK